MNKVDERAGFSDESAKCDNLSQCAGLRLPRPSCSAYFTSK